MLKCSKGEEVTELEEALVTVLDIIKSVNDSMHQIAITGFEVSMVNLFIVITMYTVERKTLNKGAIEFS